MSEQSVDQFPTRRSPAGREEQEPAESKNWLKLLGPGLVTGASDDDPSGIATYSQVGAQFGFGLLWIALFSYPLMCGIQEISGQIGRVTGRGIAGNLRKHYSRTVLYGIVVVVLVANTINLGADLDAMGTTAALVVGGPVIAYTAGFAALTLLLEVFVPYARYATYLKWMCLVLLAYVATVFVVHVPWLSALRATVIPNITLTTAGITGIVAVLGTTISPYLFFWQAEEEVEREEANPDEQPLRRAPRQAISQLHRIRVDTYTGMAISNVIAFFIILTTAVTLHAHGVTNIASATDAARALEPLAGRFAFLVFALGIIGTGLLAVPVLAGSSAYAVGEAMHAPVGLTRNLKSGTLFYSILTVVMVVGLAMNLLHIDPMRALFWSAVLNGVAAVPIMFLMMQMAANPRVMGGFTLNTRQKALGWTATAIMSLAAIGLFATWGH